MTPPDLPADPADLVPLPAQPSGVPWPTPDPDGWPTAEPPPFLVDLVDELVSDEERYGTTYGVAVVQGGRLLLDRAGGALPHFDRPPTPVTPETPLLSWSMAKSVLHCAIGILVGEGRLDPAAPAPVPAWHADPDDPRRSVTLDHLLQMRDGLAWAEDYVDAGVSDVIDMLFGSGTADVAAYAEARPLAHEPGTVFNYSSGTSNVVSAILGRALGTSGEGVRAFLLERIFEPIGATSADPRVDDAGTFVGSSYVYATARDWARFGLLALRGGEWDGRQVLPRGWIDHGRLARSADPEDGALYGAHWWVDGDRHGTFRASGFEGQTVTISPALDLVVVRLGRTPDELVQANVHPWRRRVVRAFA